MDFKSLLNKLDSMEAPPKTPAAPELPKAIKLNEDAELRVLAGTSTILAEAKKMKKEEDVKEAEERKPAKKTEREVELPSGAKVKATKVQGWQSQKADKEADKEKKKDESVEPEFKSKFMKMVEAKKADKEEKKKAKQVEEAKKEKMSKKDKKMEEGAKPDFLDLDKDGNKKEPMKSAAASKGGDKKDSGKKGMSAAQEKYFGKKNEGVESTVTELSKELVQRYKDKSDPWERGKPQDKSWDPALKRYKKGQEMANKRLSKKDESVVKSKKVVAESVETKMTFRDMMKLVVESGGQQQIDPVDKELFAWATRVAEKKLGEGFKAEVYAGMVYERMGGHFEMYDVLSETK